MLSSRSIYILKGGWSWLGAGTESHIMKPPMRGFQAAEEGCLELSSISLVLSLTGSVIMSFPNFEARRGSPGF